MQYGLKRRWFGSQPSQIKEWIKTDYEEGRADYAVVSKVTSTYGTGYTAALSLESGYSMADILYEYYGRPANMIYINRISTGKVWFVFACSGVLYSDYLISLEKLSLESASSIRNQLTQEIDRFNFLPSSSDVLVISDDVTANDQELIFFANESDIDGKEPRLEIKSKFTILKDVLPDLEKISKTVKSNQFELIEISKIRYPVNPDLIKKVLSAVGIIACLIVLKNINFEKEPDKIDLSSLPPIVIDTFKPLKGILTGEVALDNQGRSIQEGVAVKQRFVYIIQDLMLIKKLKGWKLSKYQAGRDFSTFTIENTYGSIESVKSTFPPHIFYIKPTLGGFNIARNVQVFPILNEPVRANYNKEMVWLGKAISWVWPEVDIKNSEPVKNDANQKHIESLSTVAFNKFYIEDFDSLSSIFVGRSAGFDTFEIEEISDRKAYKGFLNYKIYGVRGEFDGMVK